MSQVALGGMQFGRKMNMGILGQEDTTRMVKQALDNGVLSATRTVVRGRTFAGPAGPAEKARPPAGR